MHRNLNEEKQRQNEHCNDDAANSMFAKAGCPLHQFISADALMPSKTSATRTMASAVGREHG